MAGNRGDRELDRERRRRSRRWRRAARGPLPAVLASFTAVSAVVGVLLTSFVMPVVASTNYVVHKGVDYFESLPGDLARPPLPQRSVLLAADGSPITWFFDENRQEVPLAQIAPVLRDAVISIEDSRFYTHGGVDPKGVARAAFSDSTGGRVQGASTLTQQYVKNVLVEQAVAVGDTFARRSAVERTTTRKLREMRLSLALEQQLTKDQILEGYLNIAFFGGHTYGVEAAAERYFNATAATVTLPEAALLAGMISEPATFDPATRSVAARARRDVVLNRMLAQGKIGQAEHDRAVATPVSAPGRPPAHGCTAAGANGFFCDYVLRSLLQDPQYSALGKDADARLAAINRGGLVIRTTLDGDLQYDATKAVETAVPPKDGSGLGAAAVTVEPGTGRVLAMAQNRTYSASPGPGLTSVNYAVDHAYGGASGFQTGSSFKPFTLAAWLEAGGKLDDTVDATKRSFPFGAFTACHRHLRGRQPYSPGNSEGSETGKMKVLQATYDSVNVAYVDMESQLDLCNITDVAERLGVHLALPQTECGEDRPTTRLPHCLPSLTLGVKEIAPLAMATAYASFASGGVRCDPYPVAGIDQPGPAPGSTVDLLRIGPSCGRALEERVAHQVTLALQEVIHQGTAAGIQPLDWPAAGKTGTTDGPYDSWFVGYTAQRSTAVWVADPGRSEGGGYQRRELRHIEVAGEYHDTIFGATIAAPLWKSVMRSAMRGQEARALP